MKLNTSVYRVSHSKVPKVHAHWFFGIIGQGGSGHRVAEIIPASGLLYKASKDACKRFNFVHKNITITDVVVFP